MIGKLTGTVAEMGEDWVILDVAGVGYEVHCPSRVLSGLTERGGPASLYIETHLRAELIRLYGFASVSERQWFRLLQSVQGVGAKVAMAVLGALSPDDLASAIALGDAKEVARAHGVGPRVAQRIVAELKDKAAQMGSGAAGIAAALDAGAPAGTARHDAVSALVNLGYGRSEAASAVAAALKVAGQSARTEELIRLGLKELAR